MALSLLFSLSGALRKQPQIASIKLDASLSESHTYPARITDQPIEDGSVVSDHIINDPFRLDMTGSITNIPTLGIGTLTLPAVTAIGSLVSIFKTKNKIKDAEEEFINLRNKKTVFSVVTGLRRYKNMVLETFTFNRDATIGDALEFSATLRQIDIVSTEVITIDDTDDDSKKANQKETDEGRQTGDDLEGEELNTANNILEEGKLGFGEGRGLTGQ